MSKSFGSTTALSDVTLAVRPGQIHALLGENGAGKTTLLRVLGGLTRADVGTVSIDGRPLELATPSDAGRCGIGLVHQHFSLVPTLTGVEHALLADGPRQWHTQRRIASARARLVALANEFGLHVALDVPVGALSVGDQQQIEILRVLAADPTYVLLDEPTATLAPGAVGSFLDRLHLLARGGYGVCLITHHLDEAMSCADELSILRTGRLVGTGISPSSVSATELARLVVGDNRAGEFLSLEQANTAHEAHTSLEDTAPALAPAAAAVLELHGVSVAPNHGAGPGVRALDLEIAPGEIVALAGVEGNGQSELEDLLTGLTTLAAGTIRLSGDELIEHHPRDLIDRGMRVVPSDRHRRGVIPALSILDNLLLGAATRPPYAHRGVLDRRQARIAAAEMVEEFEIKAADLDLPVSTLSGGHAQRVVLARALRPGIKVLLACQPTRGLDVGASAFVRDRIRRSVASGVGVLLISSDLDEILALADRCLVMLGGRVVASFSGADIDRHTVGAAMTAADQTRAETAA